MEKVSKKILDSGRSSEYLNLCETHSGTKDLRKSLYKRIKVARLPRIRVELRSIWYLFTGILYVWLGMSTISVAS